MRGWQVRVLYGPQNMEQNPLKNNNFNEHHPKEESNDDIPHSSNSTEFYNSNKSGGALDQQLIDLISHGQFKSSHTLELMEKWKDSKMTELYHSQESKISDEEVFNLYLTERNNLLNKAIESLSDEDEEKFINFINENNLL